MSKRVPKDKYFIYSVFSQELQDYPYYPFIAKTHVKALSKFMDFVSNRDTICEGATLHCIGECRVNSQFEIIDGSMQPYVTPIEVNFSQRLVTKIFVLTHIYQVMLAKYFKKIFDLDKKGIVKNGKKRIKK